jgi:sugar-specific transcriptional regulator TrmB
MDPLQSLGLSKSESAAYSALVKRGSSGATILSIATGIYRTNLYDVLTKLEQKGLVRSVIHNRVRTYSATEPHNLTRLIDMQEKRLKDAKAQMQEFMRHLKTPALTKGNISVYQEREGLMHFYERLVNIAESDDSLLVIGSVGTIMDVFNYYILNLSKRIRQIKVRARVIASMKTIHWAILKRVVKHANAKLRLLPQGYMSPVAVFIFRDNVGLCNFMESPFVIIVEDKRLAASYRAHFESLWALASPEDVLD